MSTNPMNPFNHDIPAENAPLVNVQIDGEWVQMPKGINVVEAVKRVGKFLPHYCYHPKLSISGNCRMCLFEMGTPKMSPDRKPVIGADGKPEIGWMPRPQIGCATNVSEGMGIRTESPMVLECRKGVMEFLLINHPLDCPICDQAGECKLQEFSIEYGQGQSRFIEQKVKKPKHVDIGQRIVLDDERCVLCARCIRYAREVLDDDVLGIVNRGGRNTVSIHSSARFNNEYSLNTVDICPVGALTSKDFRFKMRVWFLKETKSICTSCGTGCNVTIGSREQTVYRLTPRENEEVNSQWMCDFGRLNFHYLHDEKRLTQPLGRVGLEAHPIAWSDAYRQIAQKLKNFKAEEIAIVASASSTNEELFLVKTLAADLSISLLDVVPRTWQGDKFLRSSDRNANSTGAELLGVSSKGSKLNEIKNGVASSKIKAIISLQEDLTEAGFAADALSQVPLLVFIGVSSNPTSKLAHFVLPSSTFAEKRGSMINVKGRLQRLHKAVHPPGSVADDWEIVRDIRIALGSTEKLHGIEEVFSAMAAQHPAFAGLSLSKIGDLGIELKTGVSS